MIEADLDVSEHQREDHEDVYDTIRSILPEHLQTKWTELTLLKSSLKSEH